MGEGWGSRPCRPSRPWPSIPQDSPPGVVQNANLPRSLPSLDLPVSVPSLRDEVPPSRTGTESPVPCGRGLPPRLRLTALCAPLQPTTWALSLRGPICPFPVPLGPSQRNALPPWGALLPPSSLHRVNSGFRFPLGTWGVHLRAHLLGVSKFSPKRIRSAQSPGFQGLLRVLSDVVLSPVYFLHNCFF